MVIPMWRLVLGGMRSMLGASPVGTGGTVSARYCYSVFMRHRIVAAQYGLSETPGSVVEIGPGDSLGIGLMALLTGSRRYIAVDAVRHASARANLAVFDELVRLLRNRAPIPVDGDCAEIRPQLENYAFPRSIIDDATLESALAPERLETLRRQLVKPDPVGAIRYCAPHGDMSGVAAASIDWVFSQAVMEHVDTPDRTYRDCLRCLKPGRLMTHQIDYRCHATAPEWNGHWKYAPWLWSLMRGRRPWFVNRLPHSSQRRLQAEAGFEILAEILQKQADGISRRQLARRFKWLSDEDLVTAGALVVARKAKAA